MKKNIYALLSTLMFSAVAVSDLGAQDENKSSTQSEKSDPSYAIIVLDASGSMWGQVNGEAKIVIARRVIRNLVSKLPDNVHLGLVAYGHRKKGDCADIQLLIEPGKVDSAKFVKVVNNLTPKGMTPLTSAIEFAAENLAFKEQKASVILVSDGKETCDRDPCEAAKKLEKLGVDFTAHVVAFDLTEEDAKSIACIAKETGGSFLTANDAGTLGDALQMAIDQVDEKEEPEVKLDPSTVKAPAKVPAGSVFKVEWTGPNNKGDYITVVPKDLKDGSYQNYSYTVKGSPLDLTAIMKVGPAEVRYMAAKGSKVLGRTDIEITPVQATLKAVDECVAGAMVSVEWTGPNNKGDFLTIVPKDAKDGKYLRYAYTSDGSTLNIPAPPEPGDCEIRYMSGQKYKVLGRVDIKMNKAETTLKAVAKCTVGNAVTVEWTGPNNKGDYITIVPKDAPDGKHLNYSYTTKGSPTTVVAPVDPGECEIRYMSAQKSKVFARLPITVEPAKVILKAHDQAVAGSMVLIDWSGPANKRDYITIVPKDAEDGKFLRYNYIDKGSPMKVMAPITDGMCEIRYMSASRGRVYARRDIMINAAKITIEAPKQGVAGEKITLKWTGPDNHMDFITIVPANTPEKKYKKYIYTSKKSPQPFMLPDEAGEYEIRYLAGQTRETLHRVPIKVVSE
ncbi:hypothetical protein NT6N_11920 [Oceaniferula spumae]|uniref:VWFA domain-containing protein n=1 Tax=Oceaniferula spumae TaxID=2979115 RepID=A0AAT9FJM7_9BACT